MVIVKVCTGPEQVVTPYVYFGVTVIVATIGVAPALVAVKPPMLPVPFAPRPKPGVSFTQSNDVAVPVKLIAATTPPLQTARSAGSTTDGEGATYTTTFCGELLQLEAVLT
jgi:hypothetical protein